MLRTPKILDETSVVELAKEHLSSCYPDVVANSEVDAERIAGAKRKQQLKEIESFIQMQGGNIDDLASRFGLDEDHWVVIFVVKYPAGTAGTIPPTMVRVYESDHRVELANSN